MLFTKTFWRAAAERAAKTFAQAAVAMLTGDGLGVLNVNWGDVGSVAALAAVVSVLTSVASAPFGPSGSPSLVEDANACPAPAPTPRHASGAMPTTRNTGVFDGPRADGPREL